ncbi:MAG: polyprenyl synthetase family protein [Bacillota bacterium]
MVSLQEVQRQLDSVASTLGGLSQALARYVLGNPGKLLRPVLVIASASIFESERGAHDTIRDVATAVELIHTASLVHDDIADGATFRRNRPSLNARHGNLMAVLAGDALFAAAFGLLAPYTHLGVLRVMCQAVTSMIEGELMEVANRWNLEVTEDQYLQQAALKTASLFAGSCEAGGLIAGALPGHCAMLREFGKALGTAFQILDDILDFTDQPSNLGKPCLSDVRHGTFTLPVIYALQDVPHLLVPSLTPGLSLEEAASLAQFLHESGYTARAALCAMGFLQRATDVLGYLPPGEGLAMLHDICRRLEDSLYSSHQPNLVHQPAPSKQ